MKKIREQVALRNELGAGSENRTFTFNDLWKYGDRRQIEGSFGAFESVVKWCDKEIARLTRELEKSKKWAKDNGELDAGEYYRVSIPHHIAHLKRFRRVFKRKATSIKRLVIK